MNYTPKRSINSYNHFYRIVIFLIMVGLACQGQDQIQPVDITLTDTIGYTDFGVTDIGEVNYPPSNLFDGKLNTCWVSNPSLNGTMSIYIRIPDTQNDSIYLNIFSGYGKSESLFNKNSRPREITLQYYSAFTPDGYVTETGYLCKVFQLPGTQSIALADTFGIQRFHIQYARNNIREYGAGLLQQQEYPDLIDTIELIKLEISEIYPGDQYKQDVCISEIYFDDCYSVIADKQRTGRISNVYLNANENELWIDKNDKPIKIYSDTTSNLQIIQTSVNNEWTILIAMPAETDGRVEVTYLLFDLVQEELINDNLKHVMHSYYPGEPLYLETIDNKVFLINTSADGKDAKIELRHYFY